MKENSKEEASPSSQVMPDKEKSRIALINSRIMNTDCLPGMKGLPAESVDVVITSPPYNIGTKYRTYRDNIDRNGYLNWMRDIGTEVKRIMADDGSFFLNMGSVSADPWIPWEVAFQMRDIFHLQNVIIWVKSISISKTDVGDYGKLTDDISVGHFKPVNSKRYLSRNHEYVFHFTKHGNVSLDKFSIGSKYQDKSNIRRFHRDADVKDRGDVWYIPYKTIKSTKKERPHPASFPSKLPEMCIRLHGVEKTKLVLDPFLGIGNTAVASVSLGIKCIGFEIDKYYYKYTKKMLNDMFS